MLGPPDVAVSGCGNCLLLQLSSSTTRVLQMLGHRRELTVLVRRTRDGAQVRARGSSSLLAFVMTFDMCPANLDSQTGFMIILSDNICCLETLQPRVIQGQYDSTVQIRM